MPMKNLTPTSFIFRGLTLGALSLWLALMMKPSLADEDLFEMSIEDLLSIQVTSVSKKEQNLTDSAAAIFVITNDELRRSGVTSVPEALRMVPGINVARIDSSKWAVTSRGFNGRFANKLLVLIDGRSVYSKTFSGVYWEEHSLMLENIDRIEVIRGPGGTLWGANAVNGVVNIITKSASDTQTVFVTARSGSYERGRVASSYGFSLGDNGDGRVYFDSISRGEYELLNGSDADDSWQISHGGFRLDLDINAHDTVTLQGEVFDGEFDQILSLADSSPPFRTITADTADANGHHLLGRWNRQISDTSNWHLQFNVDDFERDELFGRQQHEVYDIDFQHQFAIGERQDVVWGLGYRRLYEDNLGDIVLEILPRIRTDEIYSVFIQNEVAIVHDQFWLTLGSKFEQNDYSGSETQPSIQLLWKTDRQQTVWASLAKTVRTPARLDHNFEVLVTVVPPMTGSNPSSLPLVMALVGDDSFQPEELTTWQLGYRNNINSHLSIDLTAFYNWYDHVRSTERDPVVVRSSYVLQPLRFDNELKAETHGVEAVAIWSPEKQWRLDLAYSYLESDFALRDEFDRVANAGGPRHQISLRTHNSLTETVDFDLWLRAVDRAQATDLSTLTLVEIDGYVEVDVRLAWRPVKTLEFALVGQNLLNESHVEFVPETFTLPTAVTRSFYGSVSWSF